MSAPLSSVAVINFKSGLYRIVRDVSSDGTWGRRLAVLPVAVLEQASDIVAAPFAIVERLARAVKELVGSIFQARDCEFKRGFMRELESGLGIVGQLPASIVMAPLKIFYQVSTGAGTYFSYTSRYYS